MKEMELAKTDVVFDQEHHAYTLHGKSLQGITSTLIRWMFPDTYTYIPQDTLRKAAERGSFIHEDIELADTLGITTSQCEEAQEYVRLRNEMGLKALANEYLVTDGKDFASSIDIVFDDLSIADIKCTSKVHTDNVRLQLSIYAYFFEKMNKGRKVNRLIVVWLPKKQYGQPKFIEVERIKVMDVKKMIGAYLDGETNEKFLPLFHKDAKNEMQLVDRDILVQIESVERQIAELSKRQKELRETLRTAMELHGVTKWETDMFKVSLGKDTVRTTFDARRYQSEHPELCADYMVETTVKGRYTFTLK